MSNEPARILVVDDNEALRDNLAEALEIEGYDVVAAADGAGALARLGDGPPFRAVLLDLSMPGMDGRELLGHIRKDPRLDKLRVVITTGHTGARARNGVVADAFLVKPFGIKELLAALQQAGV
jgi:CheY-like chemotaxis protein